MDRNQRLVSGAGRAAIGGGVLGLASLATVFAGEMTRGEEFLVTAGAQLAGWASFASAALLVVGLVGLALRHGESMSAAGQAALLVLCFATAITVGAASTLALVVPTLAVEAPALVETPPAAVPPTFVLSGLVMGICTIVVAVALRRTGTVPRGATTLLLVAAVVTMVPLPSRYFLLSFATGVLTLAAQPGSLNSASTSAATSMSAGSITSPGRPASE